MTQALDTTLSTAHVVMEAGQEREAEILVRNHGDEMDQFTVQVLGPAAAWTTVVPSVVTVPAGEEEWVRVVYAPPRSAEARQGKSHVAFRVTSYNDPGTSTLEEAVVEVAGFAELEVRLDPPQRTTTRRGRFVLTAVNRGNSSVRCQASAYGLDEGEGLDILIAGPEFISEPGSTTQLPVRVQARRRFMRGQDLSLPFAVEVNGDILERPAMVEGVLNQAPVLNAARIKLLLAALALLALLLGGWFTWYSLTSGEEPLQGGSNGQAAGAPGAGGQQAPVIGEAGSAGLAGVSGSAGLPGLPGAAGNQGLAGEAGAAGLGGAAGAPGDPGAVGAAGTAGTAGTAGAAGQDGEAGTQGAPGLPGLVGGQGDPGANGENGEDGARGEAGLDGTSISLQGERATYEDLPSGLTAKEAGQAWVVSEDGQLYVWSGSQFPKKGAGVPFRGVAAPVDVTLAAPILEPRPQTLTLRHFVRSGTSALYYLRADTLTTINDISLVDTRGGTSTLTLLEPGPGPGAGSVITAGSPWSSQIDLGPSRPLLVELKCSPARNVPITATTGCEAAVTLSTRTTVPPTIPLTAPRDTVTTVTAPVVHHQIPTGATSTTYTVMAPGDDTEITAIAATQDFGGGVSVALGPVGATRTPPVVTSSTPQFFGATATPPTTETVVVTKNNPLTLTVSCVTTPATTCGTQLAFSLRRPVPRVLMLPPPGSGPVDLQVQRSTLAGSSARYQLQTSGPDSEIQSISVKDSVGSGSSLTLSPRSATPTTVAATASNAPNATPFTGRLPVTSSTPLEVEFSCSAAQATTGCAADLTVTVGLPTPTVVPLASPGTSAPVLAYDRSSGALGRFLLRPASDTVLTATNVTAQGGAADVRVSKAGVPVWSLSGSRAGAPPMVSQLVSSTVPLLVEVTCVDPAKGCSPTVTFLTSAPGATAQYLSTTGSSTFSTSYDVPNNANGLNQILSTDPQGATVTSIALTSTDPGATLAIGPAAADGRRATATPTTAWSGALIAGTDAPISADLRCSTATCSASVTVTSKPAVRDPLPLNTSTTNANGSVWGGLPLTYDPMANVSGNYALVPTTSGDVEVVSLALAGSGSRLVLPDGTSVAAGSTQTLSIFTNQSNPIPVSLRCTVAGGACSGTLTVTSGAPLKPLVISSGASQNLGDIQPGAPGRYLVQTDAPQRSLIAAFLQDTFTAGNAVGLTNATLTAPALGGAPLVQGPTFNSSTTPTVFPSPVTFGSGRPLILTVRASSPTSAAISFSSTTP